VCGTRLAEWDNDRHAYIAESYRCPGCEKVHYEEEKIRDFGYHGFHIRLIRQDLYEPAKPVRIPGK